MGKTACKLQQKNVGAHVQGTTRVHAHQACEGRWSSEFGDNAVGEKWKPMMSELGRGSEDS